MRLSIVATAAVGACAVAAAVGAWLYLTPSHSGKDTTTVTGPTRQAPLSGVASGGSPQALSLRPPSPAPAQVPQPVAQTFGGWRVQCQLDVRSRESCRAEHVVIGQDGQPELAAIAYPADAATPARLRIMPPWGVLIQAGLAIRIDDQSPLQLPIATCLASGCMAEIVLSDGMLQAMRSGAAMQIGVISAEGRPIATSVSLAGFSEAYARISGKSAP